MTDETSVSVILLFLGIVLSMLSQHDTFETMPHRRLARNICSIDSSGAGTATAWLTLNLLVWAKCPQNSGLTIGKHKFIATQYHDR
jgi:hypothetical protein